jgi:hypothetical protein
LLVAVTQAQTALMMLLGISTNVQAIDWNDHHVDI